MVAWIVSKGTAGEASEIVKLINHAYRGMGSDGVEQGWTNEVGLVEGPRTSVGEILTRLETGIFLCARETASEPLRGCVWLEPKDEKAYIGMLSVEPALQNSGLGRRLMRECESMAAKTGIRQLELTVLSPRTELRAWYERQGYERTGEVLPFPHGGQLELLVYRKTVETI